MAEFVKQGGHLVMRQQRRRGADRRGEIAHQLRHRQRRSRRQGFGDHAFVHPCAAALLGARVGIEEEPRDDALVLIEQIVVAHARVPDADSRPLAHA